MTCLPLSALSGTAPTNSAVLTVFPALLHDTHMKQSAQNRRALYFPHIFTSECKLSVHNVDFHIDKVNNKMTEMGKENADMENTVMYIQTSTSVT